MRKLDRIDHQILAILQKDGRIAISELAARVNLSTTPCSERVKLWNATALSWAITHV